MKKLILLTILLSTFLTLKSEDLTLPFLDTKAMEAYQFIQANPTYDGRGVVIFVLDNSVDPLIPGLLKTSTGETKVIDMQDFSNQVVINLSEAETEKRTQGEGLKAGSDVLFGYDKLALKPVDGKYYTGQLNESLYMNSAVPDINNNGSKDDIFKFLAFKVSGAKELLKDAPGKVKPKDDEIWVYYVDEDADGNIDDDKPKYNYKYNYDTFDFKSGDKSERPLVTLSANVDPSGSKIVINTCDGSHGSHCAGIASGYEVYGTKGNNGVAPGAYVVSLKIGSNTLSGGATTAHSMKKAYEYGVKFLKEAGFEYGVYSMSYGIGSEQPGTSEIESFLNQFAIDNPNVVVVTSNGNEGPGINSTGNPSGANNIISAGAMIPPDVLQDLYGSGRTTNWVTHFSSRGGETHKPDVVAPGAASSTVPRYERGDRFWGTSMACPQVAGACAVLISGAIQENMKLDGFMIKKAIKATARPLTGYTPVDQGSGLVNIPDAYSYLKILSERKEYEKILDYNVSTTNTYFSDNKGYSAFWKANGYFPQQGEKQDVSIRAIFPKDVSKEKQHDFYRVLDLKTDVDWLKTDRGQIYIRGELPASFALLYDNSKLQKPGLYVGRVKATAKNEKNGGWEDTEIQATVVIPHKFGPANNYTQKLTGNSLMPGDIDRVFVEVPAGASSMNIKMSNSGNKFYGMAIYLFSPDGNMHAYANVSDTDNNQDVNFRIDGDDLMEGIWEVLPYCYYQSREKSFYDLEVQFYGFETCDDVISKMDFEQGDTPEMSMKFYNSFDKSINPNITGSIMGYEINKDYNEKGITTFTKNIKVGSDINYVHFKIDMADEEYNKVTDLAIVIYDQSGKALFSSGMSRKYIDFSFRAPGPGTYKLELVPAFVSSAVQNKEWKFNILESYVYSSPVGLKVERNFRDVYPGNWYNIGLSASSSIPMAPEGTKTFGKVEFTDPANDYKILEQKILLD